MATNLSTTCTDCQTQRFKGYIVATCALIHFDFLSTLSTSSTVKGNRIKLLKLNYS